MNRRRRILTIVGCGLVALLLAAMFSTQPRESVAYSAVPSIQEALLRDGFTLVCSADPQMAKSR